MAKNPYPIAVRARSNIPCSGPGPNEPKILMLHGLSLSTRLALPALLTARRLSGHGQSGWSFYHKTAFLHDPTERPGALEPGTRAQHTHLSMRAELVYMDGPFAADYASDGHVRMWGQGDFERGQVTGLDRSIQAVARVLEETGPFVGVMGFSTGAAVATIVAALLERRERRQELGVKVCPGIRCGLSPASPTVVGLTPSAGCR